MFRKTAADSPPQGNGRKGIDLTQPIEDVCAANIETKPVDWHWHGRIPKGKLVMFDGDPDLGKSVVTMDIAARTTTGRAFPDGALCEPGNVLVANVEDGVGDTIVPRLKDHGADLKRVFIFSGVPDGRGGTRLLELPRDTALLEDRVIERQAVLLIIDPVMTMVGGDTNKDQDARKALAPLRDMADRTGVAVIAVRHLNKSVGLKAIQRGGGNMGLIGVARAGSFFAPHPDNGALKVMASHKSNLAQRPPSLVYRIVTSSVHATARVEWKGTTDHDADSLAAGNVGPQDKGELEVAQEFLRSELDHGPMWAKQIFEDAEAAGIASKTLRRAKVALRVRSEKVGVRGWRWIMPTQDCQEECRDHVDHLDHVQRNAVAHDEKNPYTKEGGQGDQGGQAEHGGDVDDHLPQRHSPSKPELKRIGIIEGKVDDVQPAFPDLAAKSDADQGLHGNVACRNGNDAIISSESEVFRLAREWRPRAGAP